MAALLKKASLLKKGSTDDVRIGKGLGIRGDKPSSSRTVSETSSMNGDGSDGKVKRKISLGKSKKRISSLFSSSSLSAQASDKDSISSPARPASHLNASTNTFSSRASTPPQEGTRPPPVRSYSGLSGKGAPPDTNGTSGRLQKLQIGETNGITDSPQSTSPVTSIVPGPPKQPTTAAGSVPGPTHTISSGQKHVETSEPTKPTTKNMYSQWDEEGGNEVDSSEDEGAFLTPDEGLSEVEEENEQPEEKGELPRPNSTSEHHDTEVTNPTLDQTNVMKGAVAGSGDISRTGESTIHRNKPVVSETRVRRHVATKKSDALVVDQAAVLGYDLDICRHILTLFLTSHMKEAEDMCLDEDPDGNHMYLTSGHGLINALKGMMTFDSEDLANALEICKATSVTSAALRKAGDGMLSRIGGIVRPGAGVQRIKSMTVLERHAELVYAEVSLMKALLAIISGGDWMGLVREALNMRTAHGIYQTLQQYLNEVDRNGFDEDIDMDFRSGVLLGSGTSSLMLSLLPGKVLKIAEVFGYAGDRKFALSALMSAGGWEKGNPRPSVDEKNEGIRRPVCDMILLTFHLVLAVIMPVDNVDVVAARNILAYNIKRYPDGVFFLYFQARLHTSECEPELANKSLQKALDLKLEYIQLQHMCLWDYAVNYLMMANWKGALDCFAILKEESNWSRAVYAYSAATCIIEMIEDGDKEAKLQEADDIMKQLPKLTKKIAGKSLPIEKLTTRKARKFESQGRRLFLPAIELAYVFGALSHTPRRDLLGKHLPRIDKMLAKLDAATPEAYGQGNEYWDDYCLGHFLRGVVQFTARYPPTEAVASAKERRSGEPPDDDLDHGAEKDFQAVLRHGPDVLLDHFIVYHCHYELGRLYAWRGNHTEAKKNFDVVMSGKLLEVNPNEKKVQGKYSLESALLLKTHAALQGLKLGEAV